MLLHLIRRILLTAAFAFVIVLSLPSIARAQSLDVLQATSLPRIQSDGKTAARKRPLALTPEGVNYQDCFDDQRIRFPLQFSGFEPQSSLRVYAAPAGVDCSVATSRNVGTAQQCWKVYGDIALTINPIVDIPVRSIIAGIRAVNQSIALPTGEADPALVDPSMCGEVDLAQVEVQFLYFAPGQTATPAQKKSITIALDTVGPSPPSGIRTYPGNRRIKVEWNNISGDGGVSALTGIRIYCDPKDGASTDAGADAAATDAAATDAPDADASTGLVCTDVFDAGPVDETGDATVLTSQECVEAGAGDDAGDDTGDETGDASTSSTCTSDVFAVGTVPNAEFERKYLCGSITGNTGSSVFASSLNGQPLENRDKDHPYAIALAATDAFGNAGALSSPFCDYPELTDDFWQDYRDSGGESSCNCGATGAPVGGAAALGGLAVAMLSVLRRRARRHHVNGKGNAR